MVLILTMKIYMILFFNIYLHFISMSLVSYLPYLILSTQHDVYISLIHNSPPITSISRFVHPSFDVSFSRSFSTFRCHHCLGHPRFLNPTVLMIIFWIRSLLIFLAYPIHFILENAIIKIQYFLSNITFLFRDCAHSPNLSVNGLKIFLKIH